MKNLLILLCLSLFINSCSSDDNSNDDETPKQELELTHYILTYPSGNVAVNSFDGSKGVNSKKNEKQTASYEYNSDNKISKYIIYKTNGDISESYTFNYDNTGKMISVDEFNNIATTENYTRILNREGNSIKTTFPKSDSENYNEEFVFNNEGLLESYTKLEPDNSFNHNLTLEYDSSKNCISATGINLDTNNTKQTVTYKYAYDNNPNPVYPHFKDNYLASIIIYTRSFFNSNQLGTLIKTFGENNSIETIYPDIVPVYGRFTYEYTYNDAGYPEKVKTTNIGTKITTVETEFFYK